MHEICEEPSQAPRRESVLQIKQYGEDKLTAVFFASRARVNRVVSPTATNPRISSGLVKVPAECSWPCASLLAASQRNDGRNRLSLLGSSFEIPFQRSA